MLAQAGISSCFPPNCGRRAHTAPRLTAAMEELLRDILARVHPAPPSDAVERVQRDRRVILKRRWLGESHWLSPECVLICALRSAAGVAFETSVPIYDSLRQEYAQFPDRTPLKCVGLEAAERSWQKHWLPAWVRLQAARECRQISRGIPRKANIFADWFVVFIPQKAFGKISMERQLAIVVRGGGEGLVHANRRMRVVLTREEMADKTLAAVCDDAAMARGLVSHPFRSRGFSVYGTDWVPASDACGKRLSARAYAQVESPTPEQRASLVFEAEKSAQVRAPSLHPAESAALQSKRDSAAADAALCVANELQFASPVPTPKRRRVDVSQFFCQAREVGERDLSVEFPNNWLICKALSELATHWEVFCKKVPNAQFKVCGYRAAINYVKELSHDLTTAADVRELVRDPNVRPIGKGIGERLGELLTYGCVQEAKGLRDSPTIAAIRELTGVWGIGPVRAGELVLQSITSVHALRARVNEDPTLLDRQQRIGLNHYEHLPKRIPRSEVGRIELHIRSVVRQLRPGDDVKVDVAGSYLRGAATCGDVDVLLSGERETVFATLPQVVAYLCKEGVVTDALMLGERKFFGVLQLEPGMLHRRLDLFAVPNEEYAFALLTNTGSAQFNRSMRCLAGRLGLCLSHKGLHLVKRNKSGHVRTGSPIPCITERDIFERLGMVYVPPTERGKKDF
jgi:DNA polymerase lambda